MDSSSTDPIHHPSDTFQTQPAQDEASTRALNGDTLARGASIDDSAPAQPPKHLQASTYTIIEPAPRPSATQPAAVAATTMLAPPAATHQQQHATRAIGASVGASLDRMDASRPWYKRRRNCPVIAALSLLVVTLTALMAATTVMYRSETSMVSLANYSPPASVASYLSMDIRISHLNLETGIGRISLSKITPFGVFAIGQGSSMLRERIEVFVNGNQYVLEAGMPAREVSAPVTLTTGHVARFPFDAHVAPVSVYAMTTGGRQGLVASVSGGQPLTSNPLVPIKVNVVGGVQSLRLAATMDPNMAAIGLVEPQIAIRRSPLTRLFGVTVFALMWGLTGAVVVVAVDVIRYAKDVNVGLLVAIAAVLVAMPGLRGVQPGVPGVGTTGDVMGFFWNMAIVGIAFITLAGYAAYQTQTQQQLHQQNKHKTG
ncbi:hypothetical protein BCR44DRAFT_34528 [Catenaria anguillulae PL171]|uniref:Uncharacterized protein n=1 Tax=Catenaria anguillulae PL171 TaxID=765915 RepID=A0A1Y2I565_9FUNG|nr:hypothetical protein BCR44DRAFT_34528 [Catenaria anguillulae PL171]